MQHSRLFIPIILILVSLLVGCQVSVHHGSNADGDSGAIHLVEQRQASLLEINHVLDDFHDAAAVADIERYFGHLTAHAVFLGTDAWERWPRDDFRNYAAPHFLGESAWAYVPQNRTIKLSETGDTAWFDETVANEKYGALRGSGVLELCSDGIWRISQYNLGFTIPNEIAGDVIEMIKASAEDANH